MVDRADKISTTKNAKGIMPDNQNPTPPSGAGTGAVPGQLADPPPTQFPEYDFTVDPAIQSVSEADLPYLSETLRDLIGHRIEGINYAEGRRSQFLNLGGALAAAGIALLTFAGGVGWIPLRAVYIELSLGSLAVGGAIWIAYAWQTNYDYPFKLQLSIWKWFYHQALPAKKAFGPGLLRNRGKARRESEYEQVSKQWPAFSKQVAGLSTPRVDATQDLKQLYQLHVNELYKNLFLTQLRTVLMRGLAGIGVGAVVVFVVALVIYHPPELAAESEWNGAGIETTATWKKTGAVRTDGLSTSDVQFRVEGSLTNRSSIEVTRSELVMLDQDGDAIPIQFVRPFRRAVVAPGKTVDFSGYFWVAGSDHEDMQTLMSR